MNETIIMDSSDITDKKRGLTGSTIKLIALVTMFIDHFGATIVEKYVMGMPPGQARNVWVIIYLIMRSIGRIAFPIYIFLLVEGLKYTRSRIKYLGRLIMFAFISEIPFDIALNIYDMNDIKNWRFIEFGYQNVFFTLACGFAAIMCIDAVFNKLNNQALNKEKKATDIVIKVVITLAIGAIFAYLAWLLKTDYSVFGVIAIIVMYLVRRKPIVAMGATCVTLAISSIIEIVALVDMALIAKYNGEKGMNIKWLFYLFYPVHLLILGLIKLWM